MEFTDKIIVYKYGVADIFMYIDVFFLRLPMLVIRLKFIKVGLLPIVSKMNYLIELFSYFLLFLWLQHVIHNIFTYRRQGLCACSSNFQSYGGMGEESFYHELFQKKCQHRSRSQKVLPTALLATE